MEFSTKKIQAMGKSLAEEMKRCGFDFENDLYEVENAMRELQRQISLAGLAIFLEDVDETLHEDLKSSASEKGFYFHSYRSTVIWSVFGKISFERHYYRYKNAKEINIKGFT